MNNKLFIEIDLEVSIKRILQKFTYEGQQEGYPNNMVNSIILNEIKNESRYYFGMNEIFIVEPIQIPATNNPAYHFPDAIEMPQIVCMAELWYFGTFRDDTKHFSSLGLVWFQNDFAFPIDQDILDKVKEIPFSKICGEFDLL